MVIVILQQDTLVPVMSKNMLQFTYWVAWTFCSFWSLRTLIYCKLTSQLFYSQIHNTEPQIYKTSVHFYHWLQPGRSTGDLSSRTEISPSLYKQHLGCSARWTRIVVHAPDLANRAGERLWEHAKGWLINSQWTWEKNDIGGNMLTIEKTHNYDTEQVGERLGSCYWVIVKGENTTVKL